MAAGIEYIRSYLADPAQILIVLNAYGPNFFMKANVYVTRHDILRPKCQFASNCTGICIG